MPDDRENRGSPDRQRINMHEPHEVRYWTKKLGVTEQELTAAVKAAGTSAKDVEGHFARNKKKP